MIGIYYLPVAFIAHETGLPVEGVLKALQRLCDLGFCSYDVPAEYVWVHEMAFDQISIQLKPNDNRVKAINEAYRALPVLSFLQAFYEKYVHAFLQRFNSILRRLFFSHAINIPYNVIAFLSLL